MKNDLENTAGLYLECVEPQRSTLLALRDMILDHDKNISETVKYGMPCFLYKRNILCYLWTDRKTGNPYILMAEGKHLDNPELEQGSRSRMKILPIDPKTDIPLRTVARILNDAIDLYAKGIVRLK